MRINHNIYAMNATRHFGVNVKNKTKSMEKLSSGYKVNRAADNAAGLSISEKMRCQIRGLNQSMQNIEDGVSFCQVADGALDTVHRILGRIEELAVQAANDTNCDEDREAIDNEVQDLKAEMQKIFRTTEFNGKKYWVEPYVPLVSGHPNDMMVYHSDSDKHNGFGGVLIDGIRYSWDDLGVGFDENGYFTSQDEITVTHAQNPDETIKLRTSPTKTDEYGNVITYHDAPPNIRRIYEWNADDTGIYVNNVLAATAEQVLASADATNDGAFYSFSYHGMDISFFAPNPDAGNWQDIVNGIHPSGFNDLVTWESTAAYQINIPDSIRLYGAQTVYISDEWKNNVADRSNYYHLDSMIQDNDGDGHGDGVRLVDNGKYASTTGNENNHTETTWEDLGIQDWGTDYDSSHQRTGTDTSDIAFQTNANSILNASANSEHTYTDSTTGFQFNFQLTDEVSLENMERELKSARVTTSIYAPVGTSIANSSVTMQDADNNVKTAASLISGGSSMSYALQRDSGKSFGSGTNVSGDNFNTSYQITNLTTDSAILNADRIELHYNLLETNNNSNTLLTMSSSISKEKLQDLVKNGGTYTFRFSNSRVMDGVPASETIDKSVTYQMSYNMTLSVNKIYDEPDYKTTIQTQYLAHQNDGALVKRLCQFEHADWFETDENGGLTDSVKTEYQSDYANYSTQQIAEQLWNNSSLDRTQESYTIIAGGQSIVITNAERQALEQWRTSAENDYDNAMTTYQTNLEKQYIETYKLLKNANPSTRQTAHPTQYIRIQETATSSTHTTFDVEINNAQKHLYIQDGANAGDHQEIRWNYLSLELIGMSNTNTLTREASVYTIDKLQKAINIISKERANFGAHQLRLERTYNNNASYSENLQQAESNIRDTDMAEEMVNNSKHDILIQAAQSMIAQANQQNQSVLQLLQ